MSGFATPERLRSRLDYDPETGVMKWKRRHENNRIDKMWNKRFAGKTITDRMISGHLRLRVDGRNYLVHRIAWAIAYGDWPEGDIDHANRIPHDNRLCNLRLATRSQNCSNSVRRKKSGYRGVFFQFGKWKAQIARDRQKIHLGGFTKPENAALAYNLAALRLHGEFAVLNHAA